MTLFQLTIQGIDRTTEVKQRLISLSVTDKSAKETDELSLTLSDHDGKLPLPSKGNQIRLWLAMPDTGELIDKGSFIIDEAEHSGTPDQMNIRAKSANFKSSLKTKRSKSYHKSTLGDIAQSVAKRHNLTLAIDKNSAKIAISHIDQHRESDINLLSRLCQQYDQLYTIKSERLIIKPIANGKSTAGTTIPSANISRQSGDQHRYKRADRTIDYKSTTASYHDKKAGKTKHIIVTNGKPHPADKLPNGKSHILTKSAKNKAQAVAIAKSTDKNKKRHSAEFELTLAKARPDIIAGQAVKVTGFRPYIDKHNWRVIECRHTLSGTGYQTQILCESGEIEKI